jgi:hypothetical protein
MSASPSSIYDNVLTWKALNDLALLERGTAPGDLRARAIALKAAILRHGVRSGAPGAKGPIFAATVSASEADFMDVPPGSLLKLPTLGFIAEERPIIRAHLPVASLNALSISFADKPWGPARKLSGSIHDLLVGGPITCG